MFYYLSKVPSAQFLFFEAETVLFSKFTISFFAQSWRQNQVTKRKIQI